MEEIELYIGIVSKQERLLRAHIEYWKLTKLNTFQLRDRCLRLNSLNQIDGEARRN